MTFTLDLIAAYLVKFEVSYNGPPGHRFGSLFLASRGRVTPAWADGLGDGGLINR